MRSWLIASTALVAALGYGGCADDHQATTGDPEPGSGDGRPTDDNTGADDARPPHMPACLARPPTGTLELEMALGEANPFNPIYADVAVDSEDGVLVAMPPSNPAFFGVHRFSKDFAAIYAKDFGELVAPDNHGNTFVVGMFDQPIDFGFGPLTPHGDGHAFLAELDAAGTVIFAREILPCGTQSLVSFALDAPRARIAVSAVGAGTVVMDLDGNVQFQLPQVLGHVAFDRSGNLVIAGSADTDAFIAKYSPSGAQLFRVTIGDASTGAPGTQQATAVAVDQHGNIFAIGTFTPGASIFGDDFFDTITPDGIRAFGAFIVKLDPSGAPLWRNVGFAQMMADIAIDPLGNAVVSGALLGNVQPNRIPFVLKVDALTGTGIWMHSMLPGIGFGSGLGIATDSCGDVYWAATARIDFGPIAKTFLLKFSI